jgi:hypothetical protein
MANLISHSRDRQATRSSFFVNALSAGTGWRLMREPGWALLGSATVGRRIFERLITRECLRAGAYRPVTANPRHWDRGTETNRQLVRETLPA